MYSLHVVLTQGNNYCRMELVIHYCHYFVHMTIARVKYSYPVT